MTVVELIERKRNGGRLTPVEWRSLMNDYGAGRVPDYQVAALAMAVYFRGMDAEETDALTVAMLESGQRLDLTHLKAPKVDKHSTGGVGDKVSIILAPLAAACGLAVPMMSGRGLGHTGGTLDKLESIPGFRTRLTLDETRLQVERIGCAMIGQTAEIAPADRRFYSLRDATATVEAIPLIAASIMSKKLAEGLNGLVLDVKTGAGAFIPKLEDALALARTMVQLGDRHGCPTVTLLTDMDSPLGEACGNSVEIAESIDILKGKGPADLREVTLALTAEMLLIGKVAASLGDALAVATRALDGGAALEKFRAMVQAQGGDPRLADDPVGHLPPAPLKVEILAARDGTVQRVEPRVIGRGIIALGGGRSRIEDDVDHAVGVLVHAKPGRRVKAGDSLATILARDAQTLSSAQGAIIQAFVLGDSALPARPLVSHRVSGAGVEELHRVGAS